jgi:ABC-type branched-subunit amino acid transport system substrate-binding protein
VKRLTALALVTALALLAAGCGSKKSSSGSTTTTQSAAAFKVGLSTDTGGLNDRSFNHLAYVGLTRAQAQLGVGYLFKHSLIKKGDQVMVVDDAEAYGQNMADDMEKLLKADGLTVDRESVTESTASATSDFSSLANKAVAIHASAVLAPTQVASDSQLFEQQLKSAGYHGVFTASDGSFDPKNFNFPGGYLSYYGADVTKVPVAKPYLATYTKLYGQTLGFGPPTFTALEMIAMAISNSCADGKTSRAEVLKDLPKVKISNSILGVPIAFDNAGDLFHGPKKGVTYFQIQPDGSYKQVASS